MENVLIEVCVDSVASAVAAERGGAGRVELCSDLLEGGITPSIGLIELIRARISIDLHVMIRPRPGDFCYSEEEIDVMRRDIEVAKSLQVDGVVFGVLEPSGRVDRERVRCLVDVARPLSVTFHRAFDISSNLFEALEDICATGADRILTSGGEQNGSQGAQTIAQIVRAAAGRVTIMAGGGIRVSNVSRIVETTSVKEIHVGLSSAVASPMLYHNPRVSMGKALGSEYQRSQVLEADVRKLQRAISQAKA